MQIFFGLKSKLYLRLRHVQICMFLPLILKNVTKNNISYIEKYA